MVDVILNLNEAVYKAMVESYLKSIKEDLLNGKYVELEGIGTLYPKYKKVANKFGREFSIKLNVKQDKKFGKELLESYESGNLAVREK